MLLFRVCLVLCCVFAGWTAENPRRSSDIPSGDTRAADTRAADTRAAMAAAGMAQPTGRASATAPTADLTDGSYPQPLPSKAAVDLDALALRWTDRGVHLPRLGQQLTEGRLAPRPIGAEYRLKPGDRLRLVTWGGTAQNEVVLVDPSGLLAIPGFGAVPVSGLTVADAQLALTELVRSHFKQAGVLIGVEKAGAIAATVVGEVNTPGYQSLPPGATVLDALAAAGGVTPQGTLRAIAVRTSDGKEQRIDLYAIAVAGEATGLNALPSGAVVFVPLRGPEVQVFGAVRRAATVECLPGDTLQTALELAGGLSAAGDADIVRVLRESDQGQGMLQWPVAQLNDQPVHDGDRMLVIRRAELAQRRDGIQIDGQVRSPGTYAWTDGLTVGDAIRLAGGLLPNAHVDQALIRRQRAEAQDVAVGAGVVVQSLNELIGPVTLSTPLEALDKLVVPAFAPLATSDLVVTVNGAVNQPGPQSFTPGMTVRQALLLAGGLRADAQVESADLVRIDLEASGARSVRRISLDLRAILSGKELSVLQPRDEVVVRIRNDQRLSITLRGAVHNSGSFTVAQGATVAEVIALAGGVTDEAFVEGIRLFRISEIAAAEEYIERLKQQLEAAVSVNQRALLGAGGGNANDIAALQITIAQQEAEIARLARARATGRLLGVDFPGLLGGRPEANISVQDQDIIEVPVRPGTLRIYGEVMNAGSLQFDTGLTVPVLIARSGGYSQQADRRRIFVVRADGAVVATAAGRGLAWSSAKRGWITTRIDTIPLQEGDTIIVPPDLTFKPSKMAIAKDLTQILFQIAVAAATVVAIAP